MGFILLILIDKCDGVYFIDIDFTIAFYGGNMIYIIHFAVAVITTIAFAILFSAPKKELIFCGLSGALGWIVYFVMTKAGFGVVISSAAATFLLTIFSRAFAVIRCVPATIYLLTGIFPLVPGAGIFYTAYNLFIDNTMYASAKAIETFEIAGAIVIGIVFGFAIPQGLMGKLGAFSSK